MGETTTIQISMDIKEILDSLKIAEKESYEEVLQRILKKKKR